MKKVLLVFGSLERGGAQLRTLDVCRILYQRFPARFDFCNLSRYADDLAEDISEAGGNVYNIPIRSKNFPRDFSRLLHEERYDAIDSYADLFSGVVLPFAKRQKVPIRIANLRGSLGKDVGLASNPLFRGLMRQSIRRSATHVVAVSRAALDDVFSETWQSSVDCRVIYNGFESLPWRGTANRHDVKVEFDLPHDSRIIINVARFIRIKNHKTILEATRLIHEIRRDVRLLLVGDGPLHYEIDGLIKHYDLKDICVRTGERKDIARLLMASDVFFFPSLSEGLPGALLEALATGLPVVASDIPPIREIAQYFPQVIFLAPPHNVEKHAKHIMTALDLSLDQSALQAHYTRTPFILENAAKAYGNVYELTAIPKPDL